MTTQRTPLDVLRDLVDMVKTPSPLMTMPRLERWHKLIREAEAMVGSEVDHKLNAEVDAKLADLFGGLK